MDEQQPPAAEHQEYRSAVVRVQSTPRSDSCRTTPHRRRQCHARQLCSGPRCLPGRRCVHDDTHFTNGSELFRQRSLPRHAVTSLVTSLVLMRLDNCNSVLVGLPANLLNRLQAVINAAARLICSARKSEHITSILMDLHWLRIQERIQYILCVLVFKCKHSLAPAYLSKQLQQVAQLESRQRLRSCSSSASSCQRPEGRRSVIDLSLLPAPGLGIVCRPLSLQRPLCHHSVDT